MKIEKCTAKFHYVNTYPKWKVKICKMIGITPLLPFYVELDFFIEGHLEIGDIVIFDNFLQARIMDKINGQINDNKDIIKYKCFFFEEMPITDFQYAFHSVQILGKIYTEK